MKTIKLIIVGLVMFLVSASKAQVSIEVNIGSPPQWGPVGYTNVRYYYLPDVEAYYDVHTSMFIYFGNGVWLHRSHLPSHYQHYDLYGGYKVVMNDYHGDRLFEHFKVHKAKYAKGYKHGSQKTYGKNPGKGNNHQNNSLNPNSTKKHGFENKSHNEKKTQNKSHGAKSQKHNGGKGGGKGKK